MQATLQSNLGDLVKSYPQTAPIMLDYGLHCVGCFANQFDTIENGARIHGMTDEEINEMLERLNKAIT
jgi:hybrid cluster-associated redox disulfide protein